MMIKMFLAYLPTAGTCCKLKILKTLILLKKYLICGVLRNMEIYISSLVQASQILKELTETKVQ